MSTALAAAMAVSVIAAPVALGKGRPVQADLTGAAEVPGPGDPDGEGWARLRLNQGRHRICYTVEVSNIAPATAMHIHHAPAGEFGPVVVTLEQPDEFGYVRGCVNDLSRADVKAIRKHRSEYYVNVHNEEHPDGAIRGQLRKWSPGRGR